MTNSNISPFYLYLIAEKGLSTNTAKAYQNDLNLLEEWMGEKACELDQERLESFIAYLRKKGDAVSSISRRISSVKMYFAYLDLVGSSHQEVLFEAPKASSLVPEVLSEEEVAALLEQGESRGYCVALELIYACGLRVSEVCALNFVDVGKDTLLVRGKGGKSALFQWQSVPRID